MTSTTPAQAAGLISFYVHPDDINKHNDVNYARIYFAADVDALLQRHAEHTENLKWEHVGELAERDRRIAELSAAPAQAAGLKRCKTIVYQQKLSRSEKGQTARMHDAYFAADVDALLQRHADESERATVLIANRDAAIEDRDRRIAELVAALENLLGAENAFDEIAAIKDARHTLNALAQHTTPQADTATSAHDESQCWEPCGELGTSAAHAVRVSQEETALIKAIIAALDDDAVIAWLYKSDSHILILDRWINLSEKNKQRHRDKYAAHIRENGRGSES